MRHRGVAAGVVLVVACGSACGNSETSTPRSEEQASAEGRTTESQAAGAAEQQAEAPAEAENPRTRDIAGLRVTPNDDGSITLSGLDRWGGRLDTTYADVRYFRNAVEVLRRSITEEQAAGIEAFAAELPTPEGEELAPPPAVAPPATMRATMQTAPRAPGTMEP